MFPSAHDAAIPGRHRAPFILPVASTPRSPLAPGWTATRVASLIEGVTPELQASTGAHRLSISTAIETLEDELSRFGGVTHRALVALPLALAANDGEVS